MMSTHDSSLRLRRVTPEAAHEHSKFPALRTRDTIADAPAAKKKASIPPPKERS